MNDFYTLVLRPRKLTMENAEELTKWLEREESGEEIEDEEDDLKENEIPQKETTKCVTGGTPESAFKGSLNLRMGVKRTINSPVTIKKLLPIKVMKKKEIQRKAVGIKKANSKILTSTPCRNVITENYEKKTIKRQ